MLLVQIVGGILIALGIFLILARAIGEESNVQVPGVTVKAPSSILVLVLGVLVFLFPVSPWWPTGEGSDSPSPSLAEPSPSTMPTPTPEPTPTPSPTSTPTPAAACVPEPLEPQNGDILDNGRTDRTDGLDWAFAWSRCPEADSYELFVVHPPATVPYLDQVYPGTRISIRDHRDSAYVIDANRFGWTWRVRARVGGLWGEWSEIRTFDLEPVNTD